MDVAVVLNTLAGEIARGDIVFPTHTEIALRVQRLLDEPDCSNDTLCKLIQAEPLLASKILGIANSIAYNPDGRAVASLNQAISKLGFATLRALAAAVVVRQMKETGRDEEHQTLAAKLWEHTANVAALARVIARRLTRQNPDDAFFAGIVHEVGGFYLVSRAGAFPGLLSSELEPWHGQGEVTVGRAVLHALDVPACIREGIETMWSGFLALPPASLGDTLLLADELSPIESPLDILAGMSRRGMNADIEIVLGHETLSGILAESADEVASLSAALGS